MTLRVLQTLSDVSNDKSTIVIPIPLDFFASRPSRSQNGSPPDSGGSAALAAASTTAAHSSAPLCELKLNNERTIAICPHCNSQFNVTEVLGNARYDRMPDVPGQQIKCGRCAKIFSLPDTEE